MEAADAKQAVDIVLLDVGALSSFADYFVICGGDSSRQLEAIGDEITQALKKEGVYAHHREGTVKSGWLLIDYGAVVVHIFAPDKRGYYGLEDLWSKAREVVRIQ